MAEPRRTRPAPRSPSRRLPAATASSALPGRVRRRRQTPQPRGVPLPGHLRRLTRPTRRRSSSRSSSPRSARTGAWSKLGYARSKNLTPYDVLIIASMIEKEVVVPRERPLVAAVIYNRLHARMPLGIDATLRYGLGIPPTKAITKRDLASDRRTTRASSAGCRRRRSRTRASPRSRRPRTRRRSTTSTSSASPTAAATSSRRASTRSTPTRGKGLTNC